MVQLLDDDQLESLECTKCHKYLSVFPVKNHATRDVTCGRCFTDDDDGIRSVLYELVAEKYLFRCINRYEGCKELLRADETQAHEETCLGNVFGCPKCRDGADMSIPKLIWHYRVCHPLSYLKENSFVAQPTGEDAILHVRDDVVFFVLMQYESKSEALRCCAVTLTDAEAMQSFSVVIGSRFEKTERRLCQTITAFDGDYYVIDVGAAGPVEVLFDLKVLASARPRVTLMSGTDGSGQEELEGEESEQELEEEPVKLGPTMAVSVSKRKFKTQLPKDFKTRFGYELNAQGTALLHEDGHEIDLTCSNCKELIRLPLFRCTRFGHQMCQNCYMICSVCIAPCKQSDSDMEISSYLKFPCRWNCSKYFTSGLRNHENSCDFRKIKCPKCPTEVGPKFMRIHLSKKHNIGEFCMDYDRQQIQKNFTRFFLCKPHFLLHNTLCYLERGPDDMVNWTLFPVVDAPNAELKLIYEDPNIVSALVSKKIRYQDLYLYTPYLIFNHK